MADNTTNIIKFGSKTFSDIKQDLISYIRQAYPEIINDFSDSSIGTMLIDLNAGVTNNLGNTIDRAFQETQLENARQRNSIYNIAKNLGFNIPLVKPSVTVVDISVLIPVLGDKPDSSYYPVLMPGAQIIGGGRIFEIENTVDWNSSVSSLGDPNRSIIPNLNSNGVIVSYLVTKREVVTNGSTLIYKRVITDDDIIPFFTVRLPETNIIEIESVILLEGTNIQTNPTNSDFKNHQYRYYEVDYLAQQKVFVENTDNSQDSNGIKTAKWINVTKKFIKEYTSNGICKVIFGSGDADVDAFRDGFLKSGVSNRYFLDNFLNNSALGEKLKPGYTLFIKYRVGGGSGSNIGVGVLNQMGNHTLICTGSRQDYRQNVIKSISVNNPIPAIGGNDGLSIEQIRNLVKYNYSSQMRSVTITDYLFQMYKMPGKFGSPFRANTYKLNNKVIISIIGIGSDGKLSNVSNTLLKENITEYLSQYRMINDYIEVKDGKIFNISIDVDIYVEDISETQIVNDVITIIRNYFDVNNYEMNQDIFIGKLQKQILDVSGVVNVIDIKFYNKVGGIYSNNVISQTISNNTTGEILITNNTIYSDKDSMFEIKYPEKDIRVFLRKKNV